MTTTLILQDDVESASFIGDSTYKLIDGSFEADIPSKKETRTNIPFSSGRDLVSMSYNNRSIRFDFMVVGSTEAAVHDGITKITRMLVRAASPTYLSGGGYNDNVKIYEGSGYVEGKNTGDNGLVLRFKLDSAAATGTITNELGTAGATPTNIVTFRIINGDLKITKSFSSARKAQIDNAHKFYVQCQLTLEAEPFALGEARIIAQLDEGSLGFQGLARNISNRFFISASSVPGDAPALTRIYTKIGGPGGITIARDAGQSVLNCSSVPIINNSSYKNDIIVYGQFTTNSIFGYEIKITQTGAADAFQWRRYDKVTGADEDDSPFWSVGSWSSDIYIQPNIPVRIDTGNANRIIYVLFQSDTGHNLNTMWFVESDQVRLTTSAGFLDTQSKLGTVNNVDINPKKIITNDISTNGNLFYAKTGSSIGSGYFTVPPGCRSKYRIVLDVSTASETTYELMSEVRFFSTSEIGGVVKANSTQPILSDWVLKESDTIHLGVLDLTPSAMGFSNHPGTIIQGEIQVKLRAVANIPSSGATFNINAIFLIPCQDDDSYLEAAWMFSGNNREVYCNYDYNNPYVAETSANHFDVNFSGYARTVGLDYTASGSPITLIPNVVNTVIFYTKTGANGDWRSYKYGNGTFTGLPRTGRVSLAIRPRYLFGG